jgi:UDP-N-acetylglucosamine--N-acetylmuramyl-(pentapeptide) pyrophosphoryl-undecaprenol N-acetylglucosamine transferase
VMFPERVFFAGGGTGGHIYPALAVAEKIARLDNRVKIHFFCSDRPIDRRILSKTGFSFTTLSAQKLSFSPFGAVRFIRSFFQSQRIAGTLLSDRGIAVVVGTGGFVSAPVCRAAYKLKTPVKLINVDIVAGRASKLCARWADEVFVQFEEAADYFRKRRLKVSVTGCPLRKGFENPNPEAARSALGLERRKKVLLVTGASSGSASINETICSLLGKLAAFADTWQIVHLAGEVHFEKVKAEYATALISNRVVGYYDEMADLLGAADLVIGRSGAVSVAEYAAANAPSICMPYPHHRDLHQYLNAGKLVEAGAAIIVDDLPDAQDRAEWLWEELEQLLKDDAKLQRMKESCAQAAKKTAAAEIARSLLASV